jgi:hypothetical protein
MSLVIDDLADDAPLALRPDSVVIRVDGKFFRAGLGQDAPKHFVKGVTYGPFAPGTHGAQFPEFAMVERDFALMRTAGINTVRVFTVPPLWLLDAAQRHGLKMLVGLPWSQHVAFLDSAEVQVSIRDAIVSGVRSCGRHEAVFAYLVGNEIPPDIIRWHGARRIETFVESLWRWCGASTRGRWSATPISPRPNISTSPSFAIFCASTSTCTTRPRFAAMSRGCII